MSDRQKLRGVSSGAAFASRVGLLLCAATLASCAVMDADPKAAFDASKPWALLPLQNHTDAPQAGESAEAILTTLLQIRGLADLQRYPALLEPGSPLPQLDERARYEQSVEWARDNGAVLGITGSVEEWRYKSGADKEPAVGLSVQVVDIATGRVLWAATGARAGWGRETVSGTAHKLLRALLANMEIRNGPHSN